MITINIIFVPLELAFLIIVVTNQKVEAIYELILLHHEVSP